VTGQLAAAAAALAAAVLAAPWRLTATVRLHAWLGGRADPGSPGVPGSAVGDRVRVVLPVVLGAAVGLLALVSLAGDGDADGRGWAGVGLGAAAGGAVVGIAAGVTARYAVRPARPVPVQPAELAGALDLLAACLRCGLPVATATSAVADRLLGAEGRLLSSVAELLALGAEPAAAWRGALTHPALAALATAAIRTARSGAAMAGAVDELAAGLRAAAGDRAEARAQRAAVLIAGPLGLCFLPAFCCLGVVPVVIGLADQLLSG